MTRGQLLDAGLLLVGVLGLVHARLVSGVPSEDAAQGSSRRAAAPPLVIPGSDSLSAIANDVAASNPFRLNRRPPADDARPGTLLLQGAPTVVAPARPTFVLKGIIGGPPWEALVDGFPGEAAQLVHVGSAFGVYAVRSVTPELVVIAGPDTTWRLVAGEMR